jgi:hypothetical protein
MDEDEILGVLTILFVVGCGIFNVACVYHQIRTSRSEDYTTFENIV